MSRDLFAAYPAAGVLELQNLTRDPPAKHAATLVALLAQAAALEETKLAGMEIYQQAIQSAGYRESLAEGMRLIDSLGISPPEKPDWAVLPEFSFFLRIDFRLATPYLGRDDRAFSVTENPVRKERVFGLPFVSPTSWKGALRHSCGLRSCNSKDRVFGPKHSDETDFEGYQGRLITYPSYFTQIGFEMINPHDRATRTGKNPIRMECVPSGAESRVAMLYVPVSDASKMVDPAPRRLREECAADLAAVARSCQALLLELGFSAKRSSGYGAASANLIGKLGWVGVKCGTVLERDFANLNDLSARAGELADLVRIAP